MLPTLAVVCSCADADPEGGVCSDATVLERDEVTFFSFDVDLDDVCPASFDAIASHAQWVSTAWGSGLPEIAYGLFGSREHPCWSCSEGAEACGWSGVLSTTRIPNRHETAHAAREINCTSLIEEGWATLFGDPFEDGATTSTLRDAVAGVEQHGRLRGEHYALAARFVALLLEQHSLDAVKQLCLSELTSEASLDAALQEVLGASLDEVQLALDEYPPWTIGELRRDQACEDVRSATTMTTMTLGCFAEGTEGMLGATAWNQQRIEIPEMGPYIFEFDTEQAVELWFELRNCERQGEGSIFYQVEVTQPKLGMPAARLLHLPAGVYVLRLMVKQSLPELTVGVTVQQSL